MTRRWRSKDAKVQEQMSFDIAVIDPEEHARRRAGKTRTCLRCAKGFPSEHAGNRICEDCKELEVWRSANAATAALAGF